MDQNELFFKTFLSEPSTPMQGATTALGIASFRVSNESFIECIKLGLEARHIHVDRVEAEFSYLRNRFLHYTPVPTNDNVLSVGTLSICIDGLLLQFRLEHDTVGVFGLTRPLYCHRGDHRALILELDKTEDKTANDLSFHHLVDFVVGAYFSSWHDIVKKKYAQPT